MGVGLQMASSMVDKKNCTIFHRDYLTFTGNKTYGLSVEESRRESICASHHEMDQQATLTANPQHSSQNHK